MGDGDDDEEGALLESCVLHSRWKVPKTTRSSSWGGGD